MELDHIFHPSHKLTYHKSVKRNVEGVVCAACSDDISSEHYSCAECNFFLHKICAQRPLELTHEFHPFHPLRLLQKSPYNNSANCDSCEKKLEGFVYHCEICQFDLDVICAFSGFRLNHLFLHEHALTHEKLVKKADKGVACAACLGEISGQLADCYSFEERKFFLHKLCAQRPLQLTHELHLLHPLILLLKSPYSEPADCNSCAMKLEGFVYHCEICQFDLDFICAFSGELKLNHVFHPQHVLTYEKVVKNADKGVACAACLEEISGQLADCYCCRKCNFFLHKLCAQRPLVLTHELHPLHPLRLLRNNPYSSPADCNSCAMKLEGFTYHCEICKFDLDFICAFLKPGNHVFHPRHVLTYEKLVKKADKGMICAGCLEEISGPLADYYSCRKCNFFLHELCSQRPVELTSSLHPQHPLRFYLKDPYKPGTVCCDSCRKAMKGFVYVCSICQFCLDFKCSFPKPENRIQHFEELHEHPLVFQTRPAKFRCDLCSSTGGEGEKEDQLYSCSVCDFYIHKSCAHTTLAQRYKGHPHPLSLVQGVPKDLQIYEGFSCDVCHNAVSPEDLVSHCARCRYFVHVRCMITDDTYLISSIKDGVDYLDDSFFKHLFMDDEFVLVNWPPRDIISELIQPFLLGKRGIVMDVQLKIRHFSHKQHDMTLFEEQAVNNDNFFEEEDEEILCNACIHPITAPYYCCQECNYFLHLACANLPSEIEHFSHSHELGLTYRDRCCHTFKCDRCQQYCNGFGYWCQTCNFGLDLTCAALPAVIMHETHEHPLFQMTSKDAALCYACGISQYTGEIIFKCTFCDVYLHCECVMKFRHIRHRWDRHHPLLLRFPPHADHPDHFMCDMCEELIDPTRWLYSCFQCDISFHNDCVPRYEYHPNIKHGGKVQVSSHHHILQYLRKATLKNSCDRCECELDCKNVFECDTCYDCFCYRCVGSELP